MAQQAVAEGGDRPELADVGRLARRLVRQVVHIARAEDASVRRLLADHLGGQTGTLPVASGSWPRYDHVNVQAGLDAWLAEPGRDHEVSGLTGFHHRVFGLADLIQPGSWQPGLGLGSVTTDSLPAGPGGVTLASGQHLKRGVLLHGAPGTGKTHTIRYLLGQLSGVTVMLLSGKALRLIAEACSVARTLQPSVIVVEDVDLIAEQREFGEGTHPLLFQLLNEMDGLGQDLDVTFLLTTNRADLLEPALAERPGRVDHAALLPVPDADARLRLLHLYQGKLRLELSEPDTVISRTEGVTASFMKELLRRAALSAADESADEVPGKPITVTDAHMAIALDQLLDTRNQLTRVLLGGQPRSGAGQVLHEGGGDLAGLGDVGEVRAAADHPEPGTADG